MPRLHALELVPDDAGRDTLMAQWQALRDAGLPSQLDHRGATNTPHVTVVSASEIPDAAVDIARVRLGAMLPVRARLSGLILLGEDRLTVARTVEFDDDVVRKILAVRTQVPGRAFDSWLPHLTLARRLPRSDRTAALDALDTAELTVTFTELRQWNPTAATIHRIAAAADPTR